MDRDFSKCPPPSYEESCWASSGSYAKFPGGENASIGEFSFSGDMTGSRVTRRHVRREDSFHGDSLLDSSKLLESSIPDGYSATGFILGRGAFATCHLVRKRRNKKFYALKQNISVRGILDDPTEATEAKIEADALRRLDHPNVIHLEECVMNAKLGLQIIMEFCDGGTLEKLIREHKKEQKLVSDPAVTQILVQILDALCHIHRQRIIHRDLKPANILLFGQDRRIVKVADFGVSKFGTFAQTTVGTPYYIAPELCEGQGYSYSADMWSLGCIVHELCCLERPFSGSSLPALIMQIMRAEPRDSIPEKFDDEIASIARRLLVLDPAQRPAAGDILEENFFASRLSRWRDEFEPLFSRACEDAQNEALRISLSNIEVSYGEPSDTEFRQEAARQLSDNTRVWRLGSGSHKLRLMEQLLESNVSEIKCGGYDSGGEFGSGIMTGFAIAIPQSRYEPKIAWGANTKGQCGGCSNTSSVRVNCPVQVRYPDNLETVSIDCGGDFAASVDSEGGIWVWGSLESLDSEALDLLPQRISDNSATWMRDQQRENARRSSQLRAAGRRSSIDEHTDANPFSSKVDEGKSSQESDNIVSTSSGRNIFLSPMYVNVLAQSLVARRVACGEDFVLIIDEEDHLWSFGSGSDGCLGHGDQDDRSVPTPVEYLIDYQIEAAACGAMHSLVLTRSKEVFTWGFNDGPVLGIGDDDIGFPKCLPVRLRRLDRCGVKCIAAGYQHSCAIDGNGSVWAWGENEYGQLGLGDTTARYLPEMLDNDIDARDISCGSSHSACVTVEGEVFLWGSNPSSNFSSDSREQSLEPTIVRLKGVSAVSVSCGAAETYVVTTSGNSADSSTARRK